MATMNFNLVVVIVFLIETYNCSRVHIKLPDVKITSPTEHLKYKQILHLCENKDLACRSNDSIVCTIRFLKGNKEYKEFPNSCYLFLANMCKYPGQEFLIVSAGTCENYIKFRRNKNDVTYKTTTISSRASVSLNRKTNDGTSGTTTVSSKASVSLNRKTNATTGREALRGKTTKKMNGVTTSPFSFLYDIDSAFDYHTCPLSCPDTYSPVCLSVNRGFGKYYKFYTFLNHCLADIYYCKNWEEFSPPPNEAESVRASPLSWSFCGSSRYLQFSRVSEVISSMGHYGWLPGSYSYSHILEPHERMPGYG